MPDMTRPEILENRTSRVLGFCFILFSFSALAFFFLVFGLISRAWGQGMVKEVHPPAAVWAIHNKEDMRAELKENEGCGMCFSVDSSRFFVTNFHILFLFRDFFRKIFQKWSKTFLCFCSGTGKIESNLEVTEK